MASHVGLLRSCSAQRKPALRPALVAWKDTTEDPMASELQPAVVDGFIDWCCEFLEVSVQAGHFGVVADEREAISQAVDRTQSAIF